MKYNSRNNPSTSQKKILQTQNKNIGPFQDITELNTNSGRNSYTGKMSSKATEKHSNTFKESKKSKVNITVENIDDQNSKEFKQRLRLFSPRETNRKPFEGIISPRSENRTLSPSPEKQNQKIKECMLLQSS